MAPHFFVLVNEESANKLRELIPSLQFVQATGLNLKEFPDSTFLTTPFVKPPEAPAVVPEVQPADAPIPA